MKKEIKNNIFMTAIIGLVCIVLFAVMFMQFKTIEETDITAIENMREAELRTSISEWKTKYEQTATKLEANRKSIEEYKQKVEKNEEASGLIDEDLEESNRILGKTNVYGEGVIITLSDNNEYDITYSDLIQLINELKYAGAEAISINDIRIMNMTEIIQADSRMLIGGQRITSPYIVKAIGNQTYLSSTLNLKDSGFIDKYKNSGKTVSLETRKSIEILKYNGELKVKYMNKGDEK